MSDEPIYRPGRVIAGRYRITSALSQGGMGAVFLAQQVSLGRDVALKVILERGSDPELIKRFDVEARAVCQLKHPNIITYHDYGRDDEGHPYLVMEFLAGYPGGKLIYGERRPRVQDLVHVVAQVCSALHEAHQKGIIHRDLKWSNVMICPQSHDPYFTKLIDFGIMKIATDGSSGDQRAMTRTGMLLGTPEYMSPEAICGMPIDGRADQYSLAVMLWEALEGRRPFDGSSHFELLRQQVQDAPPPFELAAELIAEYPLLSQVVERGLEKHPDDRYESIVVFQRALMDAVKNESRASATVPARPAAKEARPSQRGMAMPVSKRAMAESGGPPSRSNLPAPRGDTNPRPVDTRVKTGQRQADEDSPRKIPVLWLAGGFLLVAGATVAVILSVVGPTDGPAEAGAADASGAVAAASVTPEQVPAASADVIQASGHPGEAAGNKAVPADASPTEVRLAAPADRVPADRVEDVAIAAAPDVAITNDTGPSMAQADAGPTVAQVGAATPASNAGTKPVTTVERPPEKRDTAPGRLIVITDPWSYVTVNGKQSEGATVTELELKPGRYTVTVANPAQFRGKHTFSVQVKSGADARRSIKLVDHLERIE